MTSPYFIYIFGSPTSKYSDILGYWGLGLKHVKEEGSETHNFAPNR